MMMLFIFFFPVATQAEGAAGTYFIKPLLPTNQKTTINDYFDLQLAPGAEQVVQIMVHNETNDEKRFSAVVEQAITNDYGAIEYVSGLDKYDPSLRFPLPEVVTVESAVTIPAGSSGPVDVSISMPDQEFDGVLLGGIRVMEEVKDESKGGISNVFSYVMPMKLYQNETAIPNALVFHDVGFGQQDHENVVQVFLQNPQPELLRELKLEAKVVDPKTNNVLYETTRETMKLAPNSNFAFPISMGQDKIKAGNYRLELVATAVDLDEKWTKDFEVIAQEAKELNNDLVIKSGPNWRLYGLLAGLGVAIAVIAYLVYRQQQLIEMTKKTKRSKKMKRKRQRKQRDKLVIFLLAASCLAFNSGLSEAATTDGLSDATIVLKEKKDTTSTSSSSTKKPAPPRTTNGRKALPQTGSTPQAYVVTMIGSGLLASAAIIIGVQIKNGRGKQYVK